MTMHDLLTHMEDAQPVAMQFRDGPVTTTRPAHAILADATDGVLQALEVDTVRVRERYILVELANSLYDRE